MSVQSVVVCERPFAKGVAGGSAVGAGTAASHAPIGRLGKRPVALPPLGYSTVNASLTPNLRVANHCHDFDATLLVLGGEITITRDISQKRSTPGRAVRCPPIACTLSRSAPGACGQKPALPRTCPRTTSTFGSMVHGGEITVGRNGGLQTFGPGDHCETLADCQHTMKVGPEGAAYTVGKADRRATNS